MKDKEIINLLNMVIKWANDLAAAASTMRNLIEDGRTEQTIYVCNCGKVVEYRVDHINQTMGIVMLALRKKEEDRERKQEEEWANL
jgi:hypothetical protein